MKRSVQERTAARTLQSRERIRRREAGGSGVHSSCWRCVARGWRQQRGSPRARGSEQQWRCCEERWLRGLLWRRWSEGGAHHHRSRECKTAPPRGCARNSRRDVRAGPTATNQQTTGRTRRQCERGIRTAALACSSLLRRRDRSMYLEQLRRVRDHRCHRSCTADRGGPRGGRRRDRGPHGRGIRKGAAAQSQARLHTDRAAEGYVARGPRQSARRQTRVRLRLEAASVGRGAGLGEQRVERSMRQRRTRHVRGRRKHGRGGGNR